MGRSLSGRRERVRRLPRSGATRSAWRGLGGGAATAGFESPCLAKASRRPANSIAALRVCGSQIL